MEREQEENRRIRCLLLLTFKHSARSLLNEHAWIADVETRQQAAIQLWKAYHYLRRHRRAQSVPVRQFFTHLTEEQDLNLITYLADKSRQIVLCHRFLLLEIEDVARDLSKLGLEYPLPLKVAREMHSRLLATKTGAETDCCMG